MASAATKPRSRRWPFLAPGERANLVRLEFLDDESDEPSAVQATPGVAGLVEPPSNGVPGDPFDAGDRTNADTFDSEGDDGPNVVRRC